MRVVCNVYDCMLRDRFQCAERNREIPRVTDCKPEIRCLTAAVPEVCNKTAKHTKKKKKILLVFLNVELVVFFKSFKATSTQLWSSLRSKLLLMYLCLSGGDATDQFTC